jgi:hypothetical protein
MFIPFHFQNIEFKSTSNKTYKSLSKPRELEKHLNKPLNFESIQNRFQEIFHDWFEKKNKLELISDNFFGVYGQKGVLIENRFLTYVSILENYHRKNVSLDETKSVLGHYFDKVSFNKNKGVSFPNLQQRLIYILHNSSIFSKIDDLIKYTEILRDTRDFHTHLLDDKEEKSMTWEYIYNSNELLEYVIRELFLKEIGVDEFVKNINQISEIKTDEILLIRNKS